MYHPHPCGASCRPCAAAAYFAVLVGVLQPRAGGQHRGGTSRCRSPVVSHARPSQPVQQPRILIVDPEGSTGLPYAKLSARLQPFEVRVEKSLDAAVATLSRDSWDLGVVTARAGAKADVLHAALKNADPQLPMVVVDAGPNIDTARACLQAGACCLLPATTAACAASGYR